MSFIIVIPAFNPLTTLISTVEKLKKKITSHIIIVDDGSDNKYSYIFKILQEHCTILTHDQNKGKGRALKTAFVHILSEHIKAEGIVIVGAHGQHSVLDVEQIVSSTKIFSDGLILGIREFHAPDVAISSYLGNRAASFLFHFFFHRRLLDTQTSLRYIPYKELNWLKNVRGEQFNYDTNMLVAAIKRRIPIYEVPVGHAKLKKNSIIYYDEVMDFRIICQQMWESYIKREGQ